MDGPGQRLQLHHCDGLEVERLLGLTAQSDDRAPEPVLARVVALFNQSALLERREQPRRRRLMDLEPAGEFDHSCLSLHLAESEQQRRSTIDRSDYVPVEHRSLLGSTLAGSRLGRLTRAGNAGRRPVEHTKALKGGRRARSVPAPRRVVMTTRNVGGHQVPIVELHDWRADRRSSSRRGSSGETACPATCPPFVCTPDFAPS